MMMLNRWRWPSPKVLAEAYQKGTPTMAKQTPEDKSAIEALEARVKKLERVVARLIDGEQVFADDIMRGID